MIHPAHMVTLAEAFFVMNRHRGRSLDAGYRADYAQCRVTRRGTPVGPCTATVLQSQEEKKRHEGADHVPRRG